MRAHEPRRVLLEAIAQRAFPGAAVETGNAQGPFWHEAFGHLTFDAEAPETTLDSVFDLASLTKVLATSTLFMRLVGSGQVTLHEPLARWIPGWSGVDRGAVTLEDALLHATGLPGWAPLYREHRGRPDFEAAIASMPLDYQPRTRSVYSDLGFLLLGFAFETIAGRTLDVGFEQLRVQMALGDVQFLPPGAWLPRTAPTERDPWRGRLLVGEVHDENAAALGGVAAHSGLFGTVGAVGRFARTLLAARRGDSTTAFGSPATVARFTTRGDVPGSSRALGWDTMLPTSSCGTKMSPLAFGHTGFTGTSVWLDPSLDVYAVLLTNRVHPSRNNDAIRQVRPAFHDAVVDAFGR